MDAPPPINQTTVGDTADASTSTLRDQAPVYALVLVGSAAESNRLGQTAFLSPFEELHAGRGDPRFKFLGFGFHRPGEDFVVLPGQEYLAGDKMSRDQLLFVATAVGVEMTKRGRRATFVNGKEIGDETITLQENDQIHVAKQVVLRLVRRPRVLPVPPSGRPLHAFGEPNYAGIVGESLKAVQLLKELEDAAPVDYKHVLIRGETGTGKEMAAQLVHRLSPRSAGPYVSVNAAGLTESMLNAELFGTPTDVTSRGMAAKTGVIAEADQGTLFLDEIGDCTHETQKKLLRWLQEGTYNRVGEGLSRRSDVRVIGATHRGDEVFRDDFRGRLTITVELAPLRERPEDIPLLARLLLVRMVTNLPVTPAMAERRERLFFQGPSGRLEPRLSLFFVDYLLRQPFPRNTRELDGILTKALLSSTGAEITLPGVDPVPGAGAAPAPASGSGSEPRSETGRALVKSITKEQVLAALRECGGNVTRAAKLLRVSRTVMYELMDKFGIKRDPSTA